MSQQIPFTHSNVVELKMKIENECNEEEYACLQGDITVSPKQESTSQGNSNESVSSVDSNLRSKCISLDKFCDSFPDCDNQLDEPHGCSQCTKSEKRCRYQIVFLLKGLFFTDIRYYAQYLE